MEIAVEKIKLGEALLNGPDAAAVGKLVDVHGKLGVEYAAAHEMRLLSSLSTRYTALQINTNAAECTRTASVGASGALPEAQSP